MPSLLHNINKQVDQKGIFSDSSTGHAFKRLATVLLEIAQNEIPVARTENDNQGINRKKVTAKTKIE